MEELFVVEQHQRALNYDQISRHPITATVLTPDDIEDVFDYITYKKAGSVLRMLKYLVNDYIFQASLRGYLLDNR